MQLPKAWNFGLEVTITPGVLLKARFPVNEHQMCENTPSNHTHALGRLYPLPQACVGAVWFRRTEAGGATTLETGGTGGASTFGIKCVQTPLILPAHFFCRPNSLHTSTVHRIEMRAMKVSKDRCD